MSGDVEPPQVDFDIEYWPIPSMTGHKPLFINTSNQQRGWAMTSSAQGPYYDKALAGLLSLAQHRLAGWPLHPVGLAVALTNTVRGDWFGMFLAWLIKSILISYGGVILYRKVRSLFLGFIMGACVGVGGASLVYSFYYF